MRVGTGFAKTIDVHNEEKCDYMNCKACSTARLRALCEAAQKCAVVNCVGTVINPNNVLCVAGSLACKAARQMLHCWLGVVWECWLHVVHDGVLFVCLKFDIWCTVVCCL